MAAALKAAHTNTNRATPPGAHRIERLSELPALVESINNRGLKHCGTGASGVAERPVTPN